MAEANTDGAGTLPPDKPPRMPRWVLVSLIVVALVVAVAVLAQLTGVAGDHGPDRHGPPVEHGSS